MRPDSTAPLVVEFSGIPGAGKSTVMAAVRTLLATTPYRVLLTSGGVFRGRERIKEGRFKWKRRSRIQRILGYAILHVRYWRLAVDVYSTLRSRGSRDLLTLRFARAVIFVVDRLTRDLDVIRSGSADFALFDQGLIWYFREIAAGERFEIDSSLKRALHRAVAFAEPFRWLIVDLVIDPHESVARIQERPAKMGPYDRMGADLARERLSRQASFSRLLVDHLEHQPMVVGVLRLDATRPVEENAQRIVDILFSLLGESPE